MRRSPGTRRRRRRVLGAAFLAALLLGSGLLLSAWLALRPDRVQAFIEKALSSSIRGEVKFLEGARVQLWPPAVELRKLVLKSAGGGELLRIRRAAVVPSILGLLAGKVEPRRVIVEAPELDLARGPSGRLNLAEVLGIDSLAELSSLRGGGAWPSVVLKGGRVRLPDSLLSSLFAVEVPPPSAGAGEQAPDLLLSDISFSLDSRERLLLFKGEARHPLARRFGVSGSLDPATGVLEFELRAGKIDLSRPVDRLLGKEAARDVKRLALEGLVDVEGKFHYDPKTGLAPPQVTGRFLRCQLAPPDLVFPVKQLRGRFEVRGRTVELKDLEGRMGEGKLTGEAVLDLKPEGGLSALSLALKADAIPLDHRLRSQLKPSLREVYDGFRPEGTAGLEVRIEARPYPPALESVTGRVVLNGVNFTPRAFPYRFYNLRGEVVLDRGEIVFPRPLTAQARDATLSVTGRCRLADLLESGKGPSSEMSFEAHVENLPVDEELREALPLQGREIWDEFQPAGRIRGALTVRRAPGEAAPVLAAFAESQGLRILYSRFPYEVTGITGRMSFEDGPGARRLTLVDLRGQHAGQPITGEGVVEWHPRTVFRIDLHCADLTLDEELKNALSPSVKQLLDDFRFRGHARTEVVIHSVTEGGIEVKVDCDLLSGEAAYVHFPYPIALAGGHFKARGDRSVEFTDVVTREKGPDGKPERPRVVFNGGFGLQGGERLFDFHFDIRELSVDDRLRSVLPAELRHFVEGVGLQGTFEGRLSGTFSYPLDQPERRRLIYRAEGVTARDAAVDFGIQLRRIDATGGFAGGRDEAGNHYFDGTVSARSAAFNRLQLGAADLSFTFGRRHPLVEAALAGAPAPQGEFRPSLELAARITPERAREMFQVVLRNGEIYGGTSQGFLIVDVGSEREFSGEFTSGGVQVAKAAPDVFGMNDTGASGEARGRISFSGTTGDPLSIRGAGEGFIERARLVELPLFMGLWSLLLGERSSEHYFNEVALRYVIKAGKFRAQSPEGIVIKSQGIHLRGGGTMDFEGKLNLSFIPEFTRMKLPILSDIFDLLKRGLSQIWVTGDVSKPQVRFVTGAGAVQIPIDPRPRGADRPLPKELRDGPPVGSPLPPPPDPQRPGQP